MRKAQLRSKASEAKVQWRDHDFLPAALEILEAPASPVYLMLLSSICLFFAVALVWAYIGKVDVVAVAQGKVQPTGKVKLVQPLEGGRVKSVEVENGTRVFQGASLVSFDTTEAAADEQAILAALTSLRAEIVRRSASVSSASTMQDRAPALTWDVDVPLATREREERILAGEFGLYLANLRSQDAQLVQKQAEQTRLQRTIVAQRDLVKTLEERVSMRATLLGRSAGTRSGVIDATETLQYQQASLIAQEGQLGEAVAGLLVAQREKERLQESFLSDHLQKIGDAERQVDDLRQRLAKAESKIEHSIIKSPVSGTVQSLGLYAVGQVAAAGQEIMRIVPDGAPVEIEAFVSNSDIGFVETGQTVSIKVASLPYTRYGVLTGTVVKVANDAITTSDSPAEGGSGKRVGVGTTDQRLLTSVYPITVAPVTAQMDADGRAIALVPGMAVTVEIKTGTRRILEYLFSPLIAVGSEALHER